MAKKGYNIRKHHLERTFKKRLKRQGFYYGYRSFDGWYIQDPTWMDLIGNKYYMCFKNITTTIYDSRIKDKYSPNKKSQYRDLKKRGFSTSIREKDKVIVRNLIETEINEFYSED